MPNIQEQSPPGEDAVIQQIVDATLSKQRKSHQPGQTARRDVHSKSNGLVHGTFRVFADVPSELKVGLFAEAGEYAAVARLSNGALGLAADILPNIRGFALKLSGVHGTKALVGEEQGTEHDFLLANHTTLFASRAEHMLQIATGQFGELLKHSPRVVLSLAASMLKVVKNPLQIAYFSQVAYNLDGRAAKYALIPQARAPFFSLPRVFDKDYLRHGVERLLRNQEVRYTFCVQLQQDPQREPVEDPSIEWRGPLYPVAELVFPASAQPIAETDGEALSFNPWRALVEHHPLGWPGRVRKAVYVADFNWRTETNARG